MARRKVTKTADQAVESVEKVTKEAPAETSAVKAGGETAEEESVKATKAVKEKEPAKTTKTVRKKTTAKTTKAVKEKELAKETKTAKKPVRRKKAVKEEKPVEAVESVKEEKPVEAVASVKEETPAQEAKTVEPIKKEKSVKKEVKTVEEAEEVKEVKEVVEEPKYEAAMTPRRSIAFIGSECYPFVKTGGLGDVMYALPKALVKQNCDVKVILPRYKCIPWKYQEKMVYKGSFQMNLCSDGRAFYVGIMEYVMDGVVYDFIDNE